MIPPLNNKNDDEILIREILNTHSNTIAFLIGNGVHYQFHDCSISWENLLEELWFEYTGTQLTIPKGISFTEFYDIVELNFLKPKSTSLSERLRNISDSIKDYNTSKYKELFSQVVKLSQITFGIKNIDKDLASSFNEKYHQLLDECSSFCIENYEGAENLSNNECLQVVINMLSNNRKQQILRNAIKRDVASKFPEKQEYNLRSLIGKIKDFNIPILTTNFDIYIDRSVGAKRYILHPVGEQYKFTDFYPWNVCYSTKTIENPLDGFGVWHVNGLTDYLRSIKLGLSDYMACVERARKMIQSNGFNELFDGKNRNNWIGGNTWLHIIFNKDLFIFGLALEENEIFLRWLLIQRAKYSQLYKKNLKGWYVDKNISKGKRFFLEQLGFKVIEVSDYAKLYNSF